MSKYIPYKAMGEIINPGPNPSTVKVLLIKRPLLVMNIANDGPLLTHTWR